jgi:hypothetical protein
MQLRSLPLAATPVGWALRQRHAEAEERMRRPVLALPVEGKVWEKWKRRWRRKKVGEGG